MLLNVIIPTYRAKSTIAECIESIFANRHHTNSGAFEFDVTVVDSSDDETADIVEALGEPVKLIRLPDRAYPGAARNRGIEATNGDILCFIDADAYADHEWLLSIYEFMEKHGDVAAVGGPVLNGNPEEGWSRLAHWCEFSGYGSGAPEGPRRVQPTVNLAIRREAFLKYGPFLEDQFGNEDVLLTSNMKDADEELRFNRSPRVYHKNKTELSAIFRHQWRLGESTGNARVKYNLPGSFLTRPGGSFLIPFVKTHFIGWRLFTQEPGEFSQFTFLWPWVFTAMTYFSSGFLNGAREASETKK
ncbi:MAG: glycosyltransferase [bacterium]